MRWQRNVFETKKQAENPEEELSGDKNVCNKEFKVMTIKVFKECERKVDEQGEKFNKDLENSKKNETKPRHRIT